MLTLEDASTWIDSTGLCLFLPRRQQFPAPAPSFVETLIGAPSETPAPSALASARGLMIRLVESGAALPLNLFGAVSEQPDFLASPEAFPYIFSLRGGRNWKTPPPQATPLVTAIWKLLEPGAALEVSEIQAGLGHEITEAAVLRGLMDLWGGLRALPLYAQDSPTRWQLTQARFSDALAVANKIAQATALSALVSLYLESVLAAAPDEIETFLSPLSARSKVREVVNGLAATRQLAFVPVGTQAMYHIAGSLPEFVEPELQPAPQPAEQAVQPAPRPQQRRPPFDRDRPRFDRPRFDRERPPRDAGRNVRPPSGPTDRPRTGPPQRDRFAAGGRSDHPPRRKPFGDRPTYRKFEEGKRPAGYQRKPEGSGGESKSFSKRPFGQRRFDKSAPPAGERRAPDRPEFRSGGGKFPPKKFGEGGSKFPPKKFGGSPKKFSGSAKKFGASKSSSGKFGAGRPRDGEKRPFFRDRPGKPGGGKTEAGEGFRRGPGPGPAQRSGKPKPSGFSKSARPGFGKPKFAGAKSSGAKFGGKKYGGLRSGSKPAGARPGFKSAQRPGSVKPPFRKGKDERRRGKGNDKGKNGGKNSE